MATTWRIKEQNITWLERFDLGWIPDNVADRFAFLAAPGGRVGIRSAAYVGSVKLLNGDTLVIQSKYGDVDFIRMLSKATGVSLELGSDVQYNEADEKTPVRFIAEAFLRSLAEVRSQGRAFDWKDTKVVSSKRPNKRLYLKETASRVAMHELKPFAGLQRSRTFDMPENRVLTVAALHLPNVFDELEQFPDEYQAELSWWSARAPLSLAKLHADIETVATRLAGAGYYSQHDYYEPALRLALGVLGMLGLSFADGETVSGRSFLVDSNALFEEYMRRCLSDSLNDEGLIVQKAVKGDRRLFSQSDEYLIPDILILRGSEIVGVGDVKHKTPDSSDFYQMYTYLRQFDLVSGFLLTPISSKFPEDQVFTTARDGCTIHVYPVNIEDLKSVEHRLNQLTDILPLKG
ncbi:McrC family protein [Kocuria flava]|uniref:McrC family protein n=1 Tax=Kocuria flava TaxID=446860 RepID=UPI001FF588F0|nr:McrC family protein [Kocuria flava]MCJ8506092.1 McrC family protein [Kocuria flava]